MVSISPAPAGAPPPPSHQQALHRMQRPGLQRGTPTQGQGGWVTCVFSLSLPKPGPGGHQSEPQEECPGAALGSRHLRQPGGGRVTTRQHHEGSCETKNKAKTTTTKRKDREKGGKMKQKQKQKKQQHLNPIFIKYTTNSMMHIDTEMIQLPAILKQQEKCTQEMPSPLSPACPLGNNPRGGGDTGCGTPRDRWEAISMGRRSSWRGGLVHPPGRICSPPTDPPPGSSPPTAAAPRLSASPRRAPPQRHPQSTTTLPSDVISLRGLKGLGLGLGSGWGFFGGRGFCSPYLVIYLFKRKNK